MQEAGRRIYYDKNTGNIVQDIGEMQGSDGAFRETTVDEDFQSYTELSQRTKESVRLIQLKYGELSDKFSTCTGYYVDITKNPIDAGAIIFTFTTPEESLEEVKKSKCEELKQDYEKASYETFTSNAFDGTTVETYSCSATDQVRINGEVTAAMAVLQGYSTEKISWKNINQAACVEWQPKSMVNLGIALHKFVTENTDKLESLISYVNKLSTIEDVQKVTWDTVIPSV